MSGFSSAGIPANRTRTVVNQQQPVATQQQTPNTYNNGANQALGVTETHGGPTNYAPSTPTASPAPSQQAAAAPQLNEQSAITTLRNVSTSTQASAPAAPSVPDAAEPDKPELTDFSGALAGLGAASGTNNGVTETANQQPSYMGNVLRNGLGTRMYPQDSFALAGLRRAY